MIFFDILPEKSKQQQVRASGEEVGGINEQLLA